MSKNVRTRVACSVALLLLVSTTATRGGSAINVGPGDSLQAAIDRASGGDVLFLTPGVTYPGNFVLPVHSGTADVTIRTRPGDRLPVAGGRVTPHDSPRLAKIQSANAQPALRTAPGARGWRLELLEFGPNAGGAGDIINLGDGSAAQATLAQVPRDLVVDRCYIHGDPIRGQKRGISLNSGTTTVIGSHISDIKAVGIDTQAIAGWNGPGPFRIENNYLEAAGEAFLLGGATPGIRDLVPSDVLFIRNYVSRPVAWLSEKWQVKNLLELKNARRVTIAMNLFEHNWVNAQAGYAILFTPRGEHGQAAWATVEDVLFKLNIVRNTAAGINILGHDDGGPSGLARRIRITQNLFYRFDRESWGGNGFFLLIGDGAREVTVDQNTINQSGNLIDAYGSEQGAPVPLPRFTFQDNIGLHNAFGVHGRSRAVGLDSLNTFFPDAVFDHNVIAGAKASVYPASNFFPTNAELMSEYLDPATGDFQLKKGSQYESAATHGGPLGAPMRQILSIMRFQETLRDRVIAPTVAIPR